MITVLKRHVSGVNWLKNDINKFGTGACRNACGIWHRHLVCLEIQEQKMKDEKPKVLDLFAGCGGMSKGFEQAGI